MSKKRECRGCGELTTCRIGGQPYHPSCFRENRTVNGYSFQGKPMTDDNEPYICEVCGAVVDSKENDVCDDCVDDSDPQKKCGNCGETMGIDAEQCPNCKKHMADQHYSWLTNTADTDLIEDLEALADEFDRHDYLTNVDCASRLRMVMDRHRSGGND